MKYSHVATQLNVTTVSPYKTFLYDSEPVVLYNFVLCEAMLTTIGSPGP